ncbi:mucin-13-like [Parambassis ranga]|uniref:Mucin-13-like n=1 Tax=Parambassis ranga TaxID=210632 RepID=A0A6P7I1C6_9TELE|nr:mucin-13-like [Parambassis ranga]
MKITGTLFLSVCLTFVSPGSSEGNATDTTPTSNHTEPNNVSLPATLTTPLLSNASDHTSHDGHTSNAATTTSPLDSSTPRSTGTTDPSQDHTSMSSGATSKPGTGTASTHSATTGTVGTTTTTRTTATTPKGGSASLFGGCGQLLGPLISILIYVAQG